MSSLLEQAKELLTLAERGEAPDHIASIMRAFVEMAELLGEAAEIHETDKYRRECYPDCFACKVSPVLDRIKADSPTKCPKCGASPADFLVAQHGTEFVQWWLEHHPCGYQGPDDGSDVG